MMNCRRWAPLATTSAVLLAASGHAGAADDVHIWVRGFIPATAQSEVADPISHGILKASDGRCIATDQRGWSNDTAAPARLSSDFHLLLADDAPPVIKPSQRRVHSAARVRQVDCQSAQELASTQMQLLADVVGTPSQTATKTQVNILAATADPQRTWSSATINYDATFTYDRATRTLDYQAMTGAFPAYEAYASLNDGPVVTVFRSGPLRRNESAETANVELKGSVNLAGKRPKAPTNFTVQ